MQQDLEAAIDGAVGGAIATAPMSAVMVVGEKLGWMERHPPEDITEDTLDAIGVSPERSDTAQDVLAVALHFAFGAAAGALFGVAHRRLRLPIPAAVQGAAFGTAVWAVSYKGWVPALGILPPPHEDSTARPETMLAAHWVFGSVLGEYVAHRPGERRAAAAHHDA